jgi:circadian clock protein KaiC
VTLSRLPTGISGVDEILHGGLLKAGVYLVRGAPGAGKTILANQICFHHVSTGGKAAYVTLLAESHARMLENMAEFSFFRADAVPESVYYVSAFAALKDRGLPGVTELLAAEIRARKVELLILDGLVTASEAAGSVQELKLFVSELQVYSSLMGCTILLLNSVSAHDHVTPEQTMVDGILRLRHELVGSRHERTLEVVKFRGSATIGGSHAMRITEDGIVVFPRLEASRIAEVEQLLDDASLSTGVPGFDSLSHAGGYPPASVTAVAGASGSGKTLLGLHFVGQATPQEPALLFGFYESPAVLARIGASFGLDLEALRKQHALEIIWQPYGLHGLDELAYRLLRAVKRTHCKRLFIDGLGGFLSARAFEERGSSFLAALSNELRRLGTTTLVAVESEDPQGLAIPLAGHGISAMADNVVRLRIQEQAGLARRLVSMGKVRGSRLALSLRELTLSDAGLLVAPDDRGGADAGEG